MSIFVRLKEERLRLGLSQTAFAEIAGVTKSAQIKWERGTSAPTAPALAAFASAGADVLYILTGRRSANRPYDTPSQIADRLDAIERDFIDPSRWKLPEEDEEKCERRIIFIRSEELRDLMKNYSGFMSPEMVSRASSLLDIAADNKKMTLLRAADFAQRREKREQIKEQLSAWLDSTFAPSEDAKNIMAMLALEYGAPLKVVVELAMTMHWEAKRNFDSATAGTDKGS